MEAIKIQHINIFLVFTEGVLSLFSPCVLPIIPVYFAILSNSDLKSLQSGKSNYRNSMLLKNTLLFILGISTTFFILGSSASLINYLFKAYRTILIFLGGIIIILLGIFYISNINIPFLQKEKKIHIDTNKMKPLTAYVLGFAFSFAWTPCIGPILSSVLIMASTSNTIFIGNVLIAVYTIGFILPFIIMAIFYSKLFKYIDLIKKHINLIQKISGAILIIVGIIMIMGLRTNSLTNSNMSKVNKNKTNSSSKISNKIKAPDFNLVDQYGAVHQLSDYKGKIVFVNFWATWCPPCRGELPDIQKLYEEYKNNKNVVILGIASPDVGNEGSKNSIVNFLKQGGYTYPVLFDYNALIMNQYEITALPTTFIIDKDGNVYKEVTGAMDKSEMDSLINSLK